METHCCSGAGKLTHYRARPSAAVGIETESPGKRAQSVGHRARALVAEAGAQGNDLTQGRAASSIARGFDTGSLFVAAVTVNLSYMEVATTLAATPSGEPEDPAAPVPGPAAPQTVEAPVVAAPQTEAEAPDSSPEPAAPSDGRVSIFYYQAQVSFTSASITLDLLR